MKKRYAKEQLKKANYIMSKKPVIYAKRNLVLMIKNTITEIIFITLENIEVLLIISAI